MARRSEVLNTSDEKGLRMCDKLLCTVPKFVNENFCIYESAFLLQDDDRGLCALHPCNLEFIVNADNF